MTKFISTLCWFVLLGVFIVSDDVGENMQDILLSLPLILPLIYLFIPNKDDNIYGNRSPSGKFQLSDKLAYIFFASILNLYIGNTFNGTSYARDLILPTILIALILLQILLWLTRKQREKAEKNKILVAVFSWFLIFNLYGFVFLVCTNELFDPTEPEIFQVNVLSKRVSHGRHSNSYYLKLPAWGAVLTEDEYRVTRSLFYTADYGKTICIQLHKGFWQHPWHHLTTCP